MRKHLKTAFLLLLTGLVLWRLWRGINWIEVRHSLSQADPFLLAVATVVSAGTNFLRSCRWRTLLSPLTRVSLHDVFAATNIGIGASFLFGAALGEIIRPMTLTLLNRKVRPATSFLTIVVERVCDLTIVSVFFGMSLLWLPMLNFPEQSAHARELGAILLVLPALGLGTLLLFKSGFLNMPDWFSASLAHWHIAPGGLRRVSSGLLRKLITALDLLSNKRELIVVALWSAGQWLANLLGTWLIMKAFGINFGVKETLLVVCCGLVGSLVPTPGGAAGAFHAALSSGLIFLGLTIERAAAISITAHLIGFVPALAFGSYYLLRGNVNLKQLRHDVSDAAHGGEEWRFS
ncbi:MAG TPA: lysylphosphatidylglycerol synthase transmembrane domain-containing protein [Pyrinomonadaceae bacterium]|nr:lysylphosphatidylglycerol synthase transmembrane domain-containing protein [Pyrinomonadaceae bacterium]